MLICGDLNKENKVKGLLRKAQEARLKNRAFFHEKIKNPRKRWDEKMLVSKKKGAEKRPPYYLTTLMYQLIVKQIKGKLLFV